MIHIVAFLALLVQADNPAPSIVALGDSMTAGYGVPAQFSYPAQLEQALKSRGYNYRVTNLGVPGSTTNQAMSRMVRALGLQPEIVIIQIGGNDVSQGIPRQVSAANLRTMIERFKPGGAKIFFAGGRVPYLDDVAKDLGVPVIPFLNGVRGHPELLLSDGIHPTAEGYTIVVENILKAIEPAVKQRQAARH